MPVPHLTAKEEALILLAVSHFIGLFAYTLHGFPRAEHRSYTSPDGLFRIVVYRSSQFFDDSLPSHIFLSSPEPKIFRVMEWAGFTVIWLSQAPGGWP
jgi:hypothetical protein